MAVATAAANKKGEGGTVEMKIEESLGPDVADV